MRFPFPGEIASHGQLLAIDSTQPNGGVALTNCARWIVTTYTPLSAVTLLYNDTYYASTTGTGYRGGNPIVRSSP